MNLKNNITIHLQPKFNDDLIHGYNAHLDNTRTTVKYAAILSPILALYQIIRSEYLNYESRK